MTAADNSGRANNLRSLRALDVLNFLLADVQTGVGPFLTIYLARNRWNEAAVGLALTVAGLASIVTQTPAGLLIDRTRHKRRVMALGICVLAIGSCAIALLPELGSVLTAQAAIGGASSIFIPGVCAISLGIVGSAAFDARQGRNQTCNALGNVTSAVTMGWLGYAVSERSIFFFVAFLAIPTLLCLRGIRPDDIDDDAARGGQADGAWRFRDLAQDRTLLVFLVAAVAFHFANAPMLPLLGEMLAKGRGRSSMLFMSACVVTTQFVCVFVSAWSGRRASSWGRKRLLLISFAVLPVRGVLYTLTADTSSLVAIQVLDGIGVGIFNVVSVLVVADVTRGTGRFNLTLGAVVTAVGVGASLSQLFAGSIVQRFGYTMGFLSLAAVGGFALGWTYFLMPETLWRSELIDRARRSRASDAASLGQ